MAACAWALNAGEAAPGRAAVHSEVVVEALRDMRATSSGGQNNLLLLFHQETVVVVVRQQ